MFRSARLKLTVWYLLIIMCITLFFSATAYQVLTVEIRRGLHMQAIRSNMNQPSNLRENPAIPSFRGMRESDDHEPGDHVLYPEGTGFPLFELFKAPPSSFEYDVDLFNEERGRVLLSLIALNFGILAASGIAAYFLAGRTLRPIEAMVAEQKRFVSDASHELRTPLTAIRTEIEVALRDKGLSREEAQDVLRSNLEEIEKLQVLSDSLLTLGQLQSSDDAVEFEAVNITEVGEKAIRQILPIAAKKNIEIEYRPDTSFGVVVESYKNSLVELLVIFLDNAIKYSRENDKVILEMIAHKTNVSITIQDFGLGIEATDLSLIFNRFFRADMSRTNDQVHGYGLGLPIAKEIAERHHGKIHVESEPDRGTKFTIVLPCKFENCGNIDNGL